MLLLTVVLELASTLLSTVLPSEMDVKNTTVIRLLESVTFLTDLNVHQSHVPMENGLPGPLVESPVEMELNSDPDPSIKPTKMVVPHVPPLLTKIKLVMLDVVLLPVKLVNGTLGIPLSSNAQCAEKETKPETEPSLSIQPVEVPLVLSWSTILFLVSEHQT
mgnify:CR=1 FL=1